MILVRTKLSFCRALYFVGPGRHSLHSYSSTCQLPAYSPSRSAYVDHIGESTSERYNIIITFPRARLTADTIYGAIRGLETFAQLVQPDYDPTGLVQGTVTSALFGVLLALVGMGFAVWSRSPRADA